MTGKWIIDHGRSRTGFANARPNEGSASVGAARSRRSVVGKAVVVVQMVKGLFQTLVVALVMSLPPMFVEADTETVDGIAWTYIVSDGKASVGLGGSYSPSPAVPYATEGALTIPPSLGGYPVTGISRGAFNRCVNITSVTIPGSVVSIGDEVFSGCSCLTNITVDASNPVLDSRDNCNAIIESAVNILIAGCKTTVIPNSVTSVADKAFYGCDQLSSITIPGSVVSIGSGIFSVCQNLTNIVVDVANPVFDSRGNCNAIIETAGNILIAGCKATVIPNSVTSIGDRAFELCSGLVSLTIPNSVTNIGDNAFLNCSSIKTVAIPNSMTIIGSGAFAYSGLTSVTIPDSVTKIGSHAFYWCRYLSTVAIGDGVTSIGSSAFEACSRLSSLTIGSGVTSIGDFAFSGCGGLASVSIPNSVTSTGRDVFSSCSGLTSVTLGTGLTKLSVCAFRYCSNLTSVTIPSNVTAIGGGAFSGCSSLISVDIPNCVTNIESEAFSSCSSLVSVTIPESVKRIELSTFAGCRSLTSLVIPDGVTYIGRNAFANCKSLTSVPIPSTVHTIDESAFANCGGLTSVTFPKGVRYVNVYAFRYCTNLTSVTICDVSTMISAHADVFQNGSWQHEKTAFQESDAICEIIYKSNAPSSPYFDAFPYQAKLYVSIKSSGWDVEIPGIWNGRAIDYYDYLPTPAHDVCVPHDGRGHGIEVVPRLSDAIVRWSLEKDGVYQDERILLTNVCENVPIWYEVSYADYYPYTNSALVTIVNTTPEMNTVSARQRYPWNGLVDVDVAFEGPTGTAYRIELSATDRIGGTNLAVATVWRKGAEGTVGNPVDVPAPGSHRLAWNAAADLPAGFVADRVAISAKLLNPVWSFESIPAVDPDDEWAPETVYHDVQTVVSYGEIEDHTPTIRCLTDEWNLASRLGANVVFSGASMGLRIGSRHMESLGVYNPIALHSWSDSTNRCRFVTLDYKTGTIAYDSPYPSFNDGPRFRDARFFLLKGEDRLYAVVARAGYHAMAKIAATDVSYHLLYNRFGDDEAGSAVCSYFPKGIPFSDSSKTTVLTDVNKNTHAGVFFCGVAGINRKQVVYRGGEMPAIVTNSVYSCMKNPTGRYVVPMLGGTNYFTVGHGVSDTNNIQYLRLFVGHFGQRNGESFDLGRRYREDWPPSYDTWPQEVQAARNDNWVREPSVAYSKGVAMPDGKRIFLGGAGHDADGKVRMWQDGTNVYGHANYPAGHPFESWARRDVTCLLPNGKYCGVDEELGLVVVNPLNGEMYVASDDPVFKKGKMGCQLLPNGKVWIIPYDCEGREFEAGIGLCGKLYEVDFGFTRSFSLSSLCSPYLKVAEGDPEPSGIKVGLNPNGGELPGIYAQYYKGANPVYGTLPTPTRSGYTFRGWSTDGTEAGIVATTDPAPQSGIQLKAVWRAE